MRSLIGAILSDRSTALVYHGLAALDDETLAWLGPDRDLLAFLLKHPGSFAAFGRSLHVQGGRVVVSQEDRRPSHCGRRLSARHQTSLPHSRGGSSLNGKAGSRSSTIRSLTWTRHR